MKDLMAETSDLGGPIVR